MTTAELPEEGSPNAENLPRNSTVDPKNVVQRSLSLKVGPGGRKIDVPYESIAWLGGTPAVYLWVLITAKFLLASYAC